MNDTDLDQAVRRLTRIGAQMRVVTWVQRGLLAMAVLLLMVAMGTYAFGAGEQAALPMSLLGSVFGFATLGLGLWSRRRFSA